MASRRTERATTHAFRHPERRPLPYAKFRPPGTGATLGSQSAVILSDDDSRALKFRPSTKGSGVAQTPARAFAGGSRGLAPHPIAVDCGFVTKR